jgi:hypothetical protein
MLLPSNDMRQHKGGMDSMDIVHAATDHAPENADARKLLGLLIPCRGL